MEKRPINSKAEAKVYYDEILRIRQQLKELKEDFGHYKYGNDIFLQASLRADIDYLQYLEYNFLARINEFLKEIGEEPVK